MFDLFVAVPEKVIFSGKARMLVAPGALGFFEILWNHAPMVSLLIAGKLVIMDEAKKKWTWKMSGGFFEINDNRAILLADSFELCEED
ncbi:MAG: F0F1 ATP synthase subunit epsilon [Parachlamydiaceae bacterium]|nr:F0F1 ATP synthase subunit epsilon [Parachlamydiaceae bacterium]